MTGAFVLGLLDVDGFTTGDPFEVLRQPGRRIRNVRFRHRVDPTPGRDAAWVQGLPIAGPTSAVVDSWRFLAELGERRLRVGMDSARWRGLTSTERIIERARELGSADPGAAAILDRHSAGTVRPESAGERGLGEILARFRPAPEPHVWVTPRRRVDWYWRVLRLAVEFQGEVDHGHEDGRRRDAARTRELEAVAIRVLPVTPADLADADGCAAWLASVCVLRARELGVPAPVLR